MTSVQVFECLTLLTFATFLIPVRWKQVFGLVLSAALTINTLYWIIPVLQSGEALSLPFSLPFWSDQAMLYADGLSALFILLIDLTVLMGIWYSRGYLRPYTGKATKGQFALHYFALSWLHIAMILVVCLRDGLSFLVAWELMSFSSFVLVIFEAARKDILRTGISYFLQMHVGFLLILAAFLLSSQGAEHMGFTALNAYFAVHDTIPVFLLFFAGFGIKAGLFPLHTWLPHAHPAAPSHVSAIMSGIMIKMGIYGLLRVLSEINGQAFAIGVILLITGLVTGIFGILSAAVQKDLKKILAFSSIENIGIISTALGLGMLGRHTGMHTLSWLGFAGALLHICNHALYKPMLFMAAGSVYTTTHTRDMLSLGGLAHRMPQTTMFFIAGGLAISALPPFNGFYSEFLLYSGILDSLRGADIQTDLWLMAAMTGLALIGGLSLFAFTRAIGTGFLGVARSDRALHAQEQHTAILLPQYGYLLIITIVSLFPGRLLELISGILVPWLPDQLPETQVPPVISLSGPVAAACVLLGFVVLILVVRAYRMKRKPVTTGPTWGCGYTAGSPAHQYTATTFSDNLRRLFRRSTAISQRQFVPLAPEELFPTDRQYRTVYKDPGEQYLLRPAIRLLNTVMRKSTLLQTGQLRHYILYGLGFILLVFLLTILNLL